MKNFLFCSCPRRCRRLKCVCMMGCLSLIEDFGGCFEGVAGSFDPCDSLRPVLCLVSPWSPHPPPSCPLTRTNKRTSWMRRRWWGGTSFMTSLPFFSPPPPIRFSGPFVPASSLGVGGHHLYRCLGIKAPWPLLLRGGLGQRWLGQGARGKGGLPFVPASRVGFSSHRPGGRRGGARAPAA